MLDQLVTTAPPNREAEAVKGRQRHEKHGARGQDPHGDALRSPLRPCVRTARRRVGRRCARSS
jgi:hypothetical protein